jgi:uncharacterized membrane protein
MEDLIKTTTLYLSSGVEGAAALVIAVATLEAILGSLRLFVARPPAPEERKTGVRLRLGRWLAVALELLLAADILRTAVAPTWNDIGKLAAIAGLRTALNYFLAKEVEREASEQSGGTSPRHLDRAATQPGAGR